MRVRSDAVERLHFLRDYLLDLIDYIFTSFFSLQIGESDEQYQPENKIKMQEETNEEAAEEASDDSTEEATEEASDDSAEEATTEEASDDSRRSH